ncbi:sensor histidine kinase [Spongiimicrobium salis]|uniref:sensor histidine kinase n=1 Tax=Spongiimicrobium salis TaxID=1667022 RepID=UPI00374D9A2E
MDNKEVLLLKKALARQKKARIQAERILEEKSKELYDMNKHLQESNHRLQNLLNEKASELDGVFINIIDPYIVMDLQFNVINMNASAKNFLGYDHNEEHINLSQLVHKDYVEYTVESIRSLLEIGSLKNYKAKIVVKDGTEKFVQINSSVVYDAKGVPIAAQGIIRDITQETEIKNLLDDQRKELDVIVQNSPLGIVLTTEGKITKANKSFVELIGYSEIELKSLKIKDISSPEDVEASMALMEKVNSGALEHFSIVKKYAKKDGSRFFAKTTVSALRDEKGELKHQLALIEDITAQRNLEAQKEKLLKELEASNMGLREYAHIVSHDLKSPLRSLSALATWLNEDYQDVLDENGIYNLKMMQEKVESMDKLIDGILKYSTASNDALHEAEVDVNEVVKEIRDSIYIPEHVEVKIANDLPTLHADKIKIHQLFQNFLSNAVVHIEAKKGLVEIGCKDIQTHWEFYVKDNGVGIPEEYHEKIFKIFQSVGNKERSTGIGLSIVKKIIDRYNGNVWLESETGKGTTFFFTLKKKT